MAMVCAYHPDREAVGACVNCGQLICEECKTVLAEKIYCNPCANKLFTSRASADAGGAMTSTLDTGNTSGQGSLAVIPTEIKGWSWGGFCLNWIWSVGNSVWIGLLSLIPYAGFIMYIILGVKGNEWAWRYKKWDSVEHFKRTQSTWAKWGIGLWVAGIVFIIIMIILAASVNY